MAAVMLNGEAQFQRVVDVDEINVIAISEPESLVRLSRSRPQPRHLARCRRGIERDDLLVPHIADDVIERDAEALIGEHAP
jgi:hypothetical protein